MVSGEAVQAGFVVITFDITLRTRAFQKEICLAVKSTYITSPILDFFGNLLQLQDKSGWSDSQRGRLDHDDAGTSVLLGYATGIEGFVVRCH